MTTIVCCTPSYAMRMAEVAEENAVDLRETSVKAIIVAGEPGGSVPAIKERIENSWGARVVDHAGASEIGPWGYANPNGTGLHVIESEFIAEFLSVGTGEPATEGELSELVLTALGRSGCPVIRYRTSDLVRPLWDHDQESRFVFLDGGVLGRTDDMMIIRGVNIYPSAIEHILRGFPEVVEYQMTVCKEGEMDSLSIEIEDRLEQPERVAEELRLRLALRVDVGCVAMGSLPRYEAKSRRFVDLRRS
jgi:phenylacetate-CoA ligase